MAPRIPTSNQLTNSRPVWCLDLTWGGRVYRLATEPVDIDRADGAVLHYCEALSEPDLIDEVSRDGVQESVAIPLAAYLDGVDVAEQVARGYRLESARGHLYMVMVDRSTGQSGQSYTERFEILTGRLSQPVYADPERNEGFLSFSLEDSPEDDSSLLLDPDAVITATTWSGAPSTSSGKVYPAIIGTPGVFRKSSGEASTTSGSPAYPVAESGSNYTKLLIAGHDVEASTVTVFDTDGAPGQSFAVTHEVDGLGRLVAVVDISTPGSISAKSSEYWVCWNGGGGMRSPFGTKALTGLGDVCAWALLRTSKAVDIEKWIIEAGILNRIKIDTYINTADLSPQSFTDRLLDDLFVEVRPGPLGLYPHGRVLDTAMAEGLITLEEGPELEPVGPVTTRTKLSSVINRVSIRFAPRASTGDFKRSVLIAPDVDSTDPEAFSDEYAVISANRWSTDPSSPVIQSESIDLPHLYDDSSAALIARERVRVQGLGFSTRPYIAGARLGSLAAGSKFRLSSASLHREFLATVLSRQWTGTAWALTLALDEDPVRISSLKKSGN